MLISEMLSLLLESLESSDLWGIWNRIVMMLEVGAKSLFIIALLFREGKGLEMKGP